MTKVKLYNSLTRTMEEFVPLKKGKVGIYTCGPTVYHYPTIGNWRTYTLSDLVVRTLKHFGFEVTYVMNLTDVGHLTGDNEGDADTGEDRLEKAASREGKTAWEIAEFYGRDFVDGAKQLNLTQPDHLCKATEHISEQIGLVKKLLDKKLAYQIDDGIYFDTLSYEATGESYGQVSTLDQSKAGARVEPNPSKRDPRDFALWKLSPKGVKRHMEWQSPWGIGFPGWHIECSAMSMKYLGEQFDLHLGGEDLRSTHHPNEIAQAEAATGKKPFVKYWLHGAFLLVDGGRMGKSLGNAYTLSDIVAKGFEPLHLKYFYLTGHYRKPINFTFRSLAAAKAAYQRLTKKITALSTISTESSSEALTNEHLKQFNDALADDFNFPQALAVWWRVLEDKALADDDKHKLSVIFNQVLGLDVLVAGKNQEFKVSPEIESLIEQRNRLRQLGKYEEADKIRDQLEAQGYTISDKSGGSKLD